MLSRRLHDPTTDLPPKTIASSIRTGPPKQPRPLVKDITIKEPVATQKAIELSVPEEKGKAPMEETHTSVSSSSTSTLQLQDFTNFPSPSLEQIRLTQQEEAGVFEKFGGDGQTGIDLNEVIELSDQELEPLFSIP